MRSMWLTKLVADDLKLEMIEKKRERGGYFLRFSIAMVLTAATPAMIAAAIYGR